MSLLNLLDTKLADRQALGLLGDYGRISCENNVQIIGLAPVISWKSKPPFTVRVGYINYVFFSSLFSDPNVGKQYFSCHLEAADSF